MTSNPQESSQKERAAKTISTVAGAINHMTGEEGKANIRLNELFMDVFKKHTKDEKLRLFSSGLSGNIPDERSMVAQWPRPWFYSRVFAVLLPLTLLLYYLLFRVSSFHLVAAMMLLAVLMVPVTMMIFLYECNVPRNLSLADCISMFLIGGVTSLVILVLSSVVFPETSLYTWYGTLFSSLLEILALTLVIFLYIRRHDSKYILNGLLIGACVGAGFCVLENTGNLLYCSAQCAAESGGSIYLDYAMLHTGLIESWLLSFGSALVWGALIGAGITAAKQQDKLSFSCLSSPCFLKFFVTTLVLDYLWHVPLASLAQYSTVERAIIAVLGLVFLPFQISAGLRQINRLSNEAWQADAAAMPEEAED